MNNYLLTAVDGEGQQWRAAPACSASIELETKGSLDMSALTKVKFLTAETLVRYNCDINQKVCLKCFRKR